MIPCNKQAYCLRPVGHEGPCAAVPKPGEFPITKTPAQFSALTNTEWEPVPGPEMNPVDAEIIKARWTLKTLIETVQRLRYQSFDDPERISNVTLALRHLEDAESRLNRALNL